MMRIKFILLTVLMVVSCNPSEDMPPENVDDFDRQAMLTEWADNIIIPAYDNHLSKLQAFREVLVAWQNDQSLTQLNELRNQWKQVYLSWQYATIFEIGRAEALMMRGFMNTYPTDTSAIIANISDASVNLSLPSTADAQGLPAFDFLLYGLAENDTDIVTRLADPLYTAYLQKLVDRMIDLTSEVLDDWNGTYRNDFVQNVASSATGSVDKLVNDYVYYYERHLRAGKVGIPAGVFSGKIEAQTVEALYAGDFSKELLLQAIDISQDFFNGQTQINSSASSLGLADYLDYLNTIKETEDLTALINAQFDAAREKAQQLQDDFVDQLESDPTVMLEVYDELQKNVVLLKVDLMQALNVRVDYVDADGD